MSSGKGKKDPKNVIRGLEAAIHNPRVSEEARARDVERLKEMGHDPGPILSSSSRKVYNKQDVDEMLKENLPSDPGLVPEKEQIDELAEKYQTQIPPGGDPRAVKDILESGKYKGMDQSEFLNPDPDVHGNVGKSAGAKGGQAGESRVLGGYKATLKNPNVSEEAKEHARKILREHGASV